MALKNLPCLLTFAAAFAAPVPLFAGHEAGAPVSGPVFIGTIGELRQRVLDANWSIQAKILEYEIRHRTLEAAKGAFAAVLLFVADQFLIPGLICGASSMPAHCRTCGLRAGRFRAGSEPLLPGWIRSLRQLLQRRYQL